MQDDSEVVSEGCSVVVSGAVGISQLPMRELCADGRDWDRCANGVTVETTALDREKERYMKTKPE